MVSETRAAQALAGPGGDGRGPAAVAHAAPVVHVAECGDLVLGGGDRFLLVGLAQAHRSCQDTGNTLCLVFSIARTERILKYPNWQKKNW